MVLTVVGGASVAHAHGGEGLIEVGDPIATGELEVEFPVRVTYEADGHPVEQLLVGTTSLSIEGKGPGGAALSSRPSFTAGEAPGVYRATVTLPSEGQWELTVTVDDPPATETLAVEVGNPLDEGEGSDPGDPPDEPDEPEPTDTVDQDGDDTAGSGDDRSATITILGEEDADETSDDGGIPIIAVVIAVGVAIVAGAVGNRWSRNR